MNRSVAPAARGATRSTVGVICDGDYLCSVDQAGDTEPFTPAVCSEAFNWAHLSPKRFVSLHSPRRNIYIYILYSYMLIHISVKLVGSS